LETKAKDRKMHKLLKNENEYVQILKKELRTITLQKLAKDLESKE